MPRPGPHIQALRQYPVTKRSKPFSDDDTVKKHRVVFYCQIIDRKADKNDFFINLVFSMAPPLSHCSCNKPTVCVVLMAVSPTTTQAVTEEIGELLELDDFILDGGQCSIGIESTIIDCTGTTPSILRSGFVSINEISNIIKPEILNYLSPEIKFSGNFEKHYSPKAKVILDKVPKKGQGFIALSDISTPEGVIRISSPTNDLEFAHTLYESLRFVDRNKILEVVVQQPEGEGIAKAIRDRLKKAQYKK